MKTTLHTHRLHQALGAVALWGALQASAQTPPKPLDAQASDPVKMGWMVGSPPPADKLIQFADGSFYRFPQTRWSFSNYRQTGPTSNVSRGTSPISLLPRAERAEIDALTFTVTGKDETMTWAQSLSANYTDGIVVLHKGKIVYERYFGALQPQGQHSAMSVTTSLFGTLGAMLVADGTLDENAPAAQYVPELKATGFGDATVRQLLDMTTGIDYSENYANPKASIWTHVLSGHVLPRPPGYAGPKSFYGFIQTVQKEGEHGQGFRYNTVNADTLGWVISRATGKSVRANVQERIWDKLGAEQDAYFTVDTEGTEFAGGGFNAGLRDMARFGEMMRLDGKFNGQQIVPAKAVADIRNGGNPADFTKAGYPTLPGWAYRNMWWVSNNAHGAYSARGFHGQAVYIDPKAEMVIARFGSHPVPANLVFDPTSLPAFHALATYLMTKP